MPKTFLKWISAVLWRSLKRKLVKAPLIARLLRHIFLPADFRLTERLYRGFRSADTDRESGEIRVNSIRFPDFSCNWDRFSRPQDIRQRKGGLKTDGCYAFSVEASRFRDMATPCHDPLRGNYSHVEVRQLLPAEDVNYVPPKGRKLSRQEQGWSNSRKLEYRQNIVNHLERLIEPSD